MRVEEEVSVVTVRVEEGFHMAPLLDLFLICLADEISLNNSITRDL